MLEPNICRYLLSTLDPKYIKTIAECSSENKKAGAKSLVPSDKPIFDFDDITEDLYNRKKVPKSADGVLVTERKVIFVEFKSGFMHLQIQLTKLSDENEIEQFNDSKEEELQRKYRELMKENLKKANKEMKQSLLMKGMDSWMTLEKQYFLKARSDSNLVHGGHSNIHYCVVVEEENVDELDELMKSTCQKQIRKQEGKKANLGYTHDLWNALSRLNKKKDATGNDYGFDMVEVIGPREFESRLDEYCRFMPEIQ